MENERTEYTKNKSDDLASSFFRRFDLRGRDGRRLDLEFKSGSNEERQFLEIRPASNEHILDIRPKDNLDMKYRAEIIDSPNRYVILSGDQKDNPVKYYIFQNKGEPNWDN